MQEQTLETGGTEEEDDARSLGSRIVSRLISLLIVLFVTIAVLGAIGAGAWYFRPQIIERVPQMEDLYALLDEFLPSAEVPADFDSNIPIFLSLSDAFLSPDVKTSGYDVAAGSHLKWL